jgi:hypothetical protein
MPHSPRNNRERASDLDMKVRDLYLEPFVEITSLYHVQMPNENFAIVRSSCAKSTVEDVGVAVP